MIGAFLAGFLSLFGAAFLLIAALGLVRMENVYTRLHAASKAAPFGAVFILIAVALASGSLAVGIRILIIGLFLLATAPIAAHVIGRAAYLQSGPLEGGAPDDLAGRYDLESRTLESTPPDGQAGSGSDRR